MSLLAELREASIPTGPPCGVSTILALMDPVDRAELVEALASIQYKGSKIAEVLNRRGFDINGQTIQRHRRGLCRCAR